MPTRFRRPILAARLTSRLITILAVASFGWVTPPTAHAQIERLNAETPVSFDSRGRVMILTPRLATTTMKGAAWWPLPELSWREARLFSVTGTEGAPVTQSSTGKQFVAVMEVVNDNGSIVRYGLGTMEFEQLRTQFDDGKAPLEPGRNPGVRSGIELSQPAGYTFVRNQTFLGLAAYGPAMAASLSRRGSAPATGGYFLAAGGSFFVSAQMIRTRVVTRSQTILGTHGGFRGGLAGAAIGEITNAHDGPGYGVPILVGALGGTVGGFLAARGMSDGEAASSGLGADMLALTTFGVATASGAFDDGKKESTHKIALGSAIGMAGVGYLVGPAYARRASYNVTAGDASVSLTAALIGAGAGAAFVDFENHKRPAATLATAGLLGGFLLSDRLLVRKYDRSSSDAGWVRLGAIAGALMGGGVAVISKAEAQGTFGMLSAGGALGLLAADRMIAPARDAGAMRGVLRTSSVNGSENEDKRLQLMLPSAATAFMMWNQRRNTPHAASDVRSTGPITNFPAVRFAF